MPILAFGKGMLKKKGYSFQPPLSFLEIYIFFLLAAFLLQKMTDVWMKLFDLPQCFPLHLIVIPKALIAVNSIMVNIQVGGIAWYWNSFSPSFNVQTRLELHSVHWNSHLKSTISCAAKILNSYPYPSKSLALDLKRIINIFCMMF